MIDPIKANELKSIPASIPASTPLKPAFRGEEKPDTVEISDEAKEAAATEKKKPISAEDIKNKSDEITQGMEAVADGIDSAANSATSAATKVTGAFTLIGATISKLIPNCVKDFFATPKVGEDGELLMKKLSDGREVVQRTFNKKNTLIAAGVAAAIAITMAVVKHFKNKANAPKAPAAQKIEA